MGHWIGLPEELKQQIVKEIVFDGGTWCLADKEIYSIYKYYDDLYEQFKKIIINFSGADILNLSIPKEFANLDTSSNIDTLINSPDKFDNWTRDLLLINFSAPTDRA